MKIFVLGGDGFCGWPVALHLSDRGHDIVIVDDLSRRRIDRELGVSSLTPIRSMDQRRAAWRELTDKKIGFANIDVARSYDAFAELLAAERPDAIVHLAEQRSVPYSMRSATARRYTLDNNLGTTHNVLAALVECRLDAHLVHLSSVGIYGYNTVGYRIPDGYVGLAVHAENRSHEIRDALHPTNPCSVYHLSKAQDQLALAFYSQNDGVRITDLVQGTVWGSQTPQTSLDERLINRFDYDGVFGTVLNRFILQAALGHPLTIYGGGQQTRAFIHIRDVVRCIEIALDNPPARGERMKVFNQIAETKRIADLAGQVARCWPHVEMKAIDNPRNEPTENELELANTELRSLGFAPRLIEDAALEEMMGIVERYLPRCDPTKILPARGDGPLSRADEPRRSRPADVLRPSRSRETVRDQVPSHGPAPAGIAPGSGS
jgi:UDP-sulfoquinovose synthase